MTYLVQTAQSFTLILSSDGQAALVLADDIAAALAEKSAEGMPAHDLADLMLDLMGKDAAAYLSGLGAAAGVGDDLAAIHAKGGAEALGAYLEGLAEKGHGAFTDGAFQTDPNAAFSSGLFERMGASDVMGKFLGDAGGKASGDDAADGVLLDALLESQGTEMIPAWVGPVVVGALVAGYAAYKKYKEDKPKWDEATKTIADEVTFDTGNKLPEDPTGEDSDMTLAEALAQRPGSMPGTDPWTQPSGPVDENGNPVDPLDADDLDQTTQPAAPVADHVAALGAEDLAGHLDPWVNPGSGDADDFRFVDGLGAPPDTGFAHVSLSTGPVLPSASLADVLFAGVMGPGQMGSTDPLDAIIAIDEMIF